MASSARVHRRPNEDRLNGVLLLATTLLVQCAAAPPLRPEHAASQPAGPSQKSTPKMLTPAQKEFETLLQDLFAWRALDKKTILERLEAKPEHMIKVQYQRLQHVLNVENPAKHPASFMFQNDKLVMITLGDPKSLKSLTIEDAKAVLSGTPARLRSRYGKMSAVYVYPELGVSLTTQQYDSHKVQFIEIFPSQSLESYQTNIYEDPTTLMR